MNILFCSAGRRCELLKDFRKTMGEYGKIIAVDNSPYAPAIYIADTHYLVPRIDEPNYIDGLLTICRKEQIDVITTLIDPEIIVLAQHRLKFEELGVEVLAPLEATASLCFDKFKLYQHLKKHKIPTTLTFGDLPSFEEAYGNKIIQFPVFIKPRMGSGSVGVQKIESMYELKEKMRENPSLIIQEFMGDALDIDVDIYVDTITKQMVSAFSKYKLEKKLGGASKTSSFYDPKLVEFVRGVLEVLQFNGPVDMDLWYQNGQYYLSEINPRFGGAYLHAYGAGVDFVSLIENNVNGIANKPRFGNYEEDVVMMMYDSVVIQKIIKPL